MTFRGQPVSVDGGWHRVQASDSDYRNAVETL